MSLFGFGKDTEEKKADAAPAVAEKKEASTKPQKVVAAGSGDLEHVLRNPRITEKATMHSEVSAYVFDVAENVTKKTVADAVYSAYQVRPRMVRIVPVPKKFRRSMRTGKRGATGGGKKAYVYLKRGDTITVA